MAGVSFRTIRKRLKISQIPGFEKTERCDPNETFSCYNMYCKRVWIAGLETVPLFHAQFFEWSDAMEEQLNSRLYAKMKAEQDEYQAQLLAMPPEEILGHAWEYTAREDILLALEFENLPEEQARALLQSPSPLAEAVKEYRDQDVSNEGIFNALEEAAKLCMEPPIYRQTAQYAMEHSEKDAYFASRKAYEDCKRAIDDSISSHFDGMYLDKECLTEVMEKYGSERVSGVLACTILQKEWDARFSRSNREWAIKIDTSHMGKEPYPFMCESHPAVLDGFISMFRREVLEQKREEKAAAPAKRKPAERSDDFEL